MNGIRTNCATDRYVAGEDDAVLGTVATDLHTQRRGLVFCHGSGALSGDVLVSSRVLLGELASNATVHVGDLGGQTWGNDTVITRIQQAIDLLTGTYGCTKIALVGASMGGLNALNYIVRYSNQLQCAALLIPATDIVSLRSNSYLTTRWTEIDSIYGAPPSANYTGHNPIDFVNSIPSDFHMKIWWSTDDPLVYPSTVTAFLTARPQTESMSMGAVSHSVPDTFNLSIRYWLDKHLI